MAADPVPRGALSAVGGGPRPPDGLLVSTARLAEELAGESPPVLLDVRWRLGAPGWGAERFAEEHIPGARFVDLDAELAGPPGPGGRHPLPEAAAVAALVRRTGIGGGRSVVVYDGADSVAAARAWWVLRHFGVGDVRVLDGGLAAWRAAARALETGPSAGETGPSGLEAGPSAGVDAPSGPVVDPAPHADVDAGTLLPGGMPILDAAGAARTAADGVLLDARAAERFRGEVEPIDPVPGHIPGALSAPTSQNVDASGRFLPPEHLRRRFAALGVAPGRPVGAYCGSGVSAAHEVLALALAGFGASLYVGSWSEWITDPSRPIATGPR